MKLLDRYLLGHYLAAYLSCFVCLLALYGVIDAFTRVDDFVEGADTTQAFFTNIFQYYLVRVPWFFQRLNSVFLLMATLFTLVWLDYRNELIGFRAAGISSWRLIRPLLLASAALLVVGIANREWVLPPLGGALQLPVSELNSHRGQRVQGCYDAALVHIEGRVAFPDRRMVQYANITIPSPVLGQLVHMSCQEMFHQPHPETGQRGWLLMSVAPEPVAGSVPNLSRLGPGTYFLQTEITYERLTRSPDWFRYVSTPELGHLLREEEVLPHRQEALALFHYRLLQPFADLLLIVLCVQIIVAPTDQMVYLRIGLCLVLYVGKQTLEFFCNHLAQVEALDPILCAWLPLLLLGPLTVAQLVPAAVRKPPVRAGGPAGRKPPEPTAYALIFERSGVAEPRPATASSTMAA